LTGQATTALWWHCFSGVAGDMALASLFDAGASPEDVVPGLRRLPVGGWELTPRPTMRAGLAATELVIEVEQDGVERTWADIAKILSAAALPERACRRAERVFMALAVAEGRLHGVAPEKVHFHEVGSTDAVLDVVGTCLALESLGVDVVYASPVAVGTGTVRSAHGLWPNPAPAVLELLKGAPVQGTDQAHELTTPTGAALLAGLAVSFGPLPALEVKATGYGAGARDTPGTPNVLQAVVGQLPAPAHPLAGATSRQLRVLEANVDDVTGEVLAHTIATLLATGALDAWAVPAVGKKGRPAHVLSALAQPEDVPALVTVVLQETGALGIRQQTVERWALARSAVEVDVAGHNVRVKVGPYRAKAEYDDCAAAAAALGLPVREVARLAEQQAAKPGIA
jgi:uncharacterized protein (TIGR00299 family) protein